MRNFWQLLMLVIMITLGIINIQDNLSIKLIEKVKYHLAAKRNQTIENSFKNMAEIKVDQCDLNSGRQANVVVDIGVGSRKYLAKTNNNYQVTEVFAREIIPQNEDVELTQNSGRYCLDEASVVGTELKEYDQGHIIADSLGGASNTYNITPQASSLNRFGMQRKMEEQLTNALMDQKQVTNFHGQIFYPSMNSLIPSGYAFTFEIDGQQESYQFDNT